MKYGRILFALSVAGVLGVATSAQAATLGAGSIGFRATTITVVGNDILFPTAVFSFSTSNGGANTQNSNGNPTGVFAPVLENSIITSTTLNLGASGGLGDPYLVLSLNGNSFTATAILNDASGADTRVIDLRGTITGPTFDPSPAHFSLVFSQTGGPGNAIGYAGTLATIVPEPSSVIMLGLGGLGVLGHGIRRRKMA